MSEVIVKEQTTEVDERELHRLLRKDCIDGILADANQGAAKYVERYDVGRGGE